MRYDRLRLYCVRELGDQGELRELGGLRGLGGHGKLGNNGETIVNIII